MRNCSYLPVIKEEEENIEDPTVQEEENAAPFL